MSEKVLLVCTSAEPNVNHALQVLPNRVFQYPQIDFLCSLADLPRFEGRTTFRKIFVFPPGRDISAVFNLWWKLIREKYDVVVVLWCLEPYRMRAKLFALCCGGRRVLVFNENLDYSYLNAGFLKRLVVARTRNGNLIRSAVGHALVDPLKHAYWGLIRLCLFPLKFMILIMAVAELYLVRALKHEKGNVKRET